jgi:hypothetical protein
VLHEATQIISAAITAATRYFAASVQSGRSTFDKGRNGGGKSRHGALTLNLQRMPFFAGDRLTWRAPEGGLTGGILFQRASPKSPRGSRYGSSRRRKRATPITTRRGGG